MATCESCGATVNFCYTVNGKKMPVDPVPSEKGNQVVTGDQVRLATPEDRQQPGILLFTSHFATCPNAKGWRRR